MKIQIKWQVGYYSDGSVKYTRWEVSPERVPEMLEMAYKQGAKRVHLKFIETKGDKENV